MSDLPSGWIEATMDEVIELKVEQHTPLANEDFLYIDISSVDRTTKKIVNPQKLSGKEAPSRARQVVASGDVLVSMTRPNLNAVAMVSDDLDRQIASTGFDVLRASGLDSRWLYYLVRTDDFVRVMSDLVQGALYPAVRPRDIRNYTIPLAPRNEQKRIADKLDTLLTRVDSCHSHLERVPQILKRFRQSVLAAATSGRLTEEWREEKGIEYDWQKVKFSDIGTIGRGKSKHRPRNDKRLYGGDYPFIQTGDIAQSNGWITSHSQTYSEFGLKQSKLWAANTVCITIAANIANTAILSYPACFPDSVVGFVANPKKSLPQFVKWSIDVIKNDLESFAPATAQKNINLGILEEVQFDCPSLEEQAEIVRRVETLFAFADRLEKRYGTGHALVEQLTPSLLAKAFRGELVEQDPNDEPASMLLERIREAREAEKASSDDKKVSRKKDRISKEVRMLKLSEIQENHLSLILKERGRMTSEALWSASQLEIDDFYDQLKDEEAKGHLREIRPSDPDSPRMLEAT